MDGEMAVTDRVIVRDSQTRHGVEGVKVTYFSRRDIYMIEVATVRRQAGLEDGSASPEGVSAETDRNGNAILHFRGRAAFLYRGSTERIVRKEWWPDGAFRFEKAGYESMQTKLGDLFTAPPYVGREIPSPVVVELKRK